MNLVKKSVESKHSDFSIFAEMRTWSSTVKTFLSKELRVMTGALSATGAISRKDSEYTPNIFVTLTVIVIDSIPLNRDGYTTTTEPCWLLKKSEISRIPLFVDHENRAFRLLVTSAVSSVEVQVEKPAGPLTCTVGASGKSGAETVTL